MDNFLETSLKNIFRSGKYSVNKTNFSTYIKLLSPNLPTKFLFEIDGWCEKNLDKKNRQNSKMVLKASFISLWEKDISKSDLLKVESYFPILSIKEQQKVLSYTQKNNLNFSIDNSTLKKLTPFTQAIQDYRLGISESLELYLLKAESITSTEYERLEKFIPSEKINDYYLKRLGYSKLKNKKSFFIYPFDFLADSREFKSMLEDLLSNHKKKKAYYGTGTHWNLALEDRLDYLLCQYGYYREFYKNTPKDKQFYYYLSSFLLVLGNAQKMNILEEKYCENLLNNLESLMNIHPLLKKYSKNNSLNTSLDLLRKHSELEPIFLNDYETYLNNEGLDDYYDYFMNGKTTLNYFVLNKMITSPKHKNMVNKI